MENRKPFSFTASIIPFLIMISTMLYSVVVLDISPHVPLIIGTIVAGIITYFHGYTWGDIETYMYRGIRLALPAVIIILLVGLVIGSWLGGGIVATMIYYGLNIISPNYFLITVVIICSIVSLTIGSSWSTMATIGVAALGIGVGLGIPVGPTAGAIVSGAFFGDKMSPLSDTTNLASGLTHTNIFKHIRHMLYTTIPATIITLIVFQWLTMRTITHTDVNIKDIEVLQAGILDHFVISPWLLLAPVIVFLVIMLKLPAAPSLIVGALLGTLSQLFVQGDTLAGSLGTLIDGFSIETGNSNLDELFNRGGMMDMMFVVTMTIVAMSFAGIMEFSGMLENILNQILKVAKNTFGLVTSTLMSALFVNVTCAEHYIAIVVPGRMFIRPFVRNNLDTSNLSRTLEDGGTITSVFVPWSTDGVFIYSTLGITVAQFAPFAVMNYTAPIIAMILAATGFGIKKITNQEKEDFFKQYYPEELDTLKN